MTGGRPQAATYKRSWKNYLLNSKYQLRFTLFMVAIAALLMVMLAWGIRSPSTHEPLWPTVMGVAESSTKVSVNTLQGLGGDDPAQIAALKAQESQLQWILVGTVLLLCGGLFVFGIKMTHKVAGPLHKVGLYLDKVKDGKYDTVYNLRKGDQLMEFFEHFKEAHSALRKAQEKDVQTLRELIAAAEKSDAAPQLLQSITELRALLASKEAGLV
jgi:hypothetical protein